MTYATATNVAVELGRPASSADETAQWEAWLARVERTIERRFTRAGLVLADQVALDDPTAEDVADAEVAAVIRKITNPLGLTSVTRTIDDGTVTTRREGAEDADGLALTAEEWDILLPSTSAAAFSTRPGFEPDTSPEDLSWT
jgi:hypothetical protein